MMNESAGARVRKNREKEKGESRREKKEKKESDKGQDKEAYNSLPPLGG